MKLSTGEVCEIAGIPMNQLDRWVVAGLVGPANAFEGHGRHRRYTFGQCLAVAAGALYRREGAGPERVTGVVRLIASMPIERLEAHLEKGETFPVPAMMLSNDLRPACWLMGMMIKPPKDDLAPGAAALMRRLDIKALYDEVKGKIAAMQEHARQDTFKTGRRRALRPVPGRRSSSPARSDLFS